MRSNLSLYIKAVCTPALASAYSILTINTNSFSQAAEYSSRTAARLTRYIYLLSD